MSRKKDPNDPKTLARCACGIVMDFTEILKCAKCGAIRCSACAKRFRKRPYCKPCWKDVLRAENSPK